jgi:hypothetical protein
MIFKPKGWVSSITKGDYTIICWSPLAAEIL